jgi:hypothetical protein
MMVFTSNFRSTLHFEDLLDMEFLEYKWLVVDIMVAAGGINLHL